MAFTQLPLLSALADKMRWHQARQTLLAENVANAETPGYRGRDLANFDFGEHMKANSTASVVTVATNPNHFVAQSRGAEGGFTTGDAHTFEITPEGNGITLEDEMMKVTANQMDYQAITTLYTRSLKLIRTALGRSA
jgi:flagellar basal-body rod protein FlgB